MSRPALWPRSLAGRTAVSLLSALAVVQALGLFIHALDRVDLQRLAQARDTGLRIGSIYRAVAATPPEQRAAALRESGSEASAGIDPEPSLDDLPPRHSPIEPLLREALRLTPMPPHLRPRHVLMREHHGRLAVAMQLPDETWLNLRLMLPPPSLWQMNGFAAAFGLMTVAAALLILWAVRRLTEPVRTLAAAAEALGRDVNAPALPEDGPAEVAVAAAAFNTMAARIRRFVGDRTLLLAAIGHDLRTPITRMTLRAEFIEDDELRARFLSDLDELETMVSATLAFGRDAAGGEPVAPLDLPELLRTILDEAGDAWPETTGLGYDGPDHLTVRARSVALKRALSNLVVNAVKYGGGARIRLAPSEPGLLTITVEDDGPGIPPDELGRVFEPFYRLEASRNRETGGTGLGLPIARNILRAHGGDVTLANRPEGGLRAAVTLPA